VSWFPASGNDDAQFERATPPRRHRSAAAPRRAETAPRPAPSLLHVLRPPMTVPSRHPPPRCWSVRA